MKPILFFLFSLLSFTKGYCQSADEYLHNGNEKSRANNYLGAIADYNKAIEANPNCYEAYNNRGFQKYKLKDDTGAMADFNKAIEINPGFSMAYLNRGKSNSRQGNYEGAVADYTKAIEIDPGFMEAYHLRGLEKVIHLGQKDNGCIDLLKAKELGCTFYDYEKKEFCQ